MDNNNRPNPNNNEPRVPLGMSSFGPKDRQQLEQKDRQQFGQNVRLAIACIEGSPEAVTGPAIPTDEASIRTRLKALTQEITSQHADLLELLVRFDDLQGWKTSGASHCAAWMNVEIGISIQLSWEYLRVGRKLLKLPTVKALFRAGKLSWSKVRLITRVADENNEKLLCHAALDASVSDVKRLCEEYRWNDDENLDTENDRALKQWESRALTWNEDSNGSTRIQLVLPPAIAQAFLNSVEQSLNHIESTDTKMSQRRADAAVLMAETSLQNAGKDIATSDRYQVIVSVDALSHAADTNTPLTQPTKRPTVNGTGPIAFETAKRISCDCSITINETAGGEPIDIGRKSRMWPKAMERAIKQRDEHCVWPGCTQSRHLHIHHIKHWSDGGKTSVDNAACLCAHHHTLVHEGGYAVQHINNEQRKNEQFKQQQCANDISMFDFEIALRNDRASFDRLRKLSPSRYRFRIVDSNGQDILHREDTNCANFTKPSTLYPDESTRVDSKNHTSAQSRDYIHAHSIDETPPNYCLSTFPDNVNSIRDAMHH